MANFERRLLRLEQTARRQRPRGPCVPADKPPFDYDKFAAIFAEATANYSAEDWERYHRDMAPLLAWLDSKG